MLFLLFRRNDTGSFRYARRYIIGLLVVSTVRTLNEFLSNRVFFFLTTLKRTIFLNQFLFSFLFLLLLSLVGTDG